MSAAPTLEFFGTTTFRLKAKGLTIFHDAWLDKPALLPRSLNIDDVAEADYIVISHAHFDHLPGADRLALHTGASVIANGEAINLLRNAGVPESQLIAVGGGERVPLFTRDVLKQAAEGTCEVLQGPPGSPARPHPSLATLAVHVWPSLHCLMPGKHLSDLPEIFDTGRVYTGETSQFECQLDITHGMTHGLLRLHEILPVDKMDYKMETIADHMKDRKRNLMSGYDGGQLMYNFIIDDKAVLFNTHLGAYEGIMKLIEPQPEVAVLGIAGRANHNGRPFEGSAAQFASKQLQWLGNPRKVIWALHDESLLPPFSVNTGPATELVKQETGVEVVDLPYAKPYTVFD